MTRRNEEAASGGSAQPSPPEVVIEGWEESVLENETLQNLRCECRGMLRRARGALDVDRDGSARAGSDRLLRQLQPRERRGDLMRSPVIVCAHAVRARPWAGGWNTPCRPCVDLLDVLDLWWDDVEGVGDRWLPLEVA